MKKVIVIFFLSVYVFSATEAGELLSLPVLVQHFMAHKQEDHTMTFFKFLKLHYENRNTDDYKDTRLPFKSHSHALFIAHTFAIPPSCCHTIHVAFIDRETQATAYKEHYLKSAYLSYIWQPPKSC